MSLNLSFPLYKIYDTYRDAHYALENDIREAFEGLNPVLQAFGVEMDKFRPLDPTQMAPFPELLHAVATTSSSRFSSVFRKLDDLSLIREMIAEIRAASKSREARMQHTIQLQREDQFVLPNVTMEPDLKKVNEKVDVNDEKEKMEKLVQQKRIEFEEEMRSRIELFVSKEQELQSKVDQMGAEIKRLEQINTELAQRMKKETEQEQSLRKQEADLVTDYEIKIKNLENELKELSREKFIYESGFAIKKAQCEDELHTIKQALVKVRSELDAAVKAQQATKIEIEDVEQQKQQNAVEVAKLAETLSKAMPIIDRNLQKVEYVMENRDELISSALNELMKANSRVESGSFGFGREREEREEKCLLFDKLVPFAPKIDDNSSEITKNAEKYQIPAEYVSDLTGSQVPVADWAVGELLARCISQSSEINPDTVFQTPQQRITVYDLFGITNHPYDNKARQTQNWSLDKLSQREIEIYNSKMGFFTQKHHQTHHK